MRHYPASSKHLALVSSNNDVTVMQYSTSSSKARIEYESNMGRVWVEYGSSELTRVEYGVAAGGQQIANTVPLVACT